VKLLFDQNLSFKLVARLIDLFPGSAHVREFNMQTADDEAVWDFAKTNGFTIVSKDDDFHERSFVRGAPPKVIGIGLGNCSTDQIESLLRWRVDKIRDFDVDQQGAFLLLS
jgi:predicted nuclease of predicted toxin-antitoxin system